MVELKLVTIGFGGFDKGGKYRVGKFGARSKFGVELNADKEGVVANLDCFHNASVGGFAAYDKSAFFKCGKIVGIEFVSMAVSLLYDVLVCIRFFDFRAVF